MRAASVILVVGLGLARVAGAEMIDLASFTPPPGWQRVDRPGSVTYGTLDAGTQKYGAVTVFASVPSSGDPNRDFEAAWAELVPGTAVAQRTQQTTPQGFPILFGGAQTVQNRVAGVTLVTTIIAHDRVVRILAQSNTQEHLKALDAMIGGIQIAAAAAPPSNGPADLSDFVYTAPPGWRSIPQDGGRVLLADGRDCALELRGVRPSAPKIEDDADLAYHDAFAGWKSRNDAGTPYTKMAKGIHADGWEFMKVQSFLERGGVKMLGIVFVARLDGKTAVIVGSRANSDSIGTIGAGAAGTPLCLDEYLATDWPTFFHALHFKSWKPRPGALAEKLVGKWRTSTAHISVGYIFDDKGRYATASGYNTYANLDFATILKTTHGLFGNGAYKLSWSELAMTGDDGKKENARVRWQNTWELGYWHENLMLLEKRPDGTDYELCLRRE